MILMSKLFDLVSLYCNEGQRKTLDPEAVYEMYNLIQINAQRLLFA